jgi:mannose-1-phosphate guanylyltransferase
MTSALILAAGFGTRLWPLTLELPKPLVPVGDRPLLAHIAARCRAAGIERLVANAHHEHQKLSSIISELSLNIDVVVEPEIRGTAGGVAGARDHFDVGAVLVWNGDILTDAPVKALLALASERDAQVLSVSPRRAAEGNVGLDERGCVVRLRGKSYGSEAASADYIGVMALGPGVVARLPERGCLMADVAMPALAAGGKVWTVPTTAAWSDLGDLTQYVSANFAWLDRYLALNPHPSILTPNSWIDESATLAAEVRLERSLIGPGANVSGVGAVTEVIAWPGAAVLAPLSRAVVVGSGRVVPFDGPAEN